MSAVQVEHVVKRYGEFSALRDVSLAVEKGEIFGIIGPDGAGKTTLFRILATLLLPSEGSARVDGFDTKADYQAIRDRLGYMPGRFSLYGDLSVEENLRFFASIFHTTPEENYELIRDIYVQLEPFRKRRSAALSGGMKQKLALCCALVHKPSVLLLDEPTTGVDPVSRKEFWQMLARLREQGITILVSTPYMDEASLCDRIALMRTGEILQIDTPSGIVASFGMPLYAVRGDDMFGLLRQVRAWRGTLSCYAFGDRHHLTVAEGHSLDDLRAFLSEKGCREVTIEPIEPSVEDCYMKLEKSATP